MIKYGHMNNWDDRRYFLEVARSGSLRKASERLNVSRSTVQRRILALEKGLGVRLFERLPSGYFTTQAGEVMLTATTRMEEEALTADRMLAGTDARLSGTIRVAVPGAVLANPMIREFAAFTNTHPYVHLELLTAYRPADLARREADVALRITNDPPEDLIGRRILKVARACYVAKQYLPKTTGPNKAEPRWINPNDKSLAEHWTQASDHHGLTTGMVIDDPVATREAVIAGLGIAVLPCFMADGFDDLYRMPPGKLILEQDLWILTHKDLRGSARIRVFMQFMASAFLRHRALYEGTALSN